DRRGDHSRRARSAFAALGQHQHGDQQDRRRHQVRERGGPPPAPQPQLLHASSAASTSSACVTGFTLCMTFFTVPSASMTKVERKTPMYSRPANFFFPQTPYSSATAWSVSASSVKGSPYFSLNLTCERSLSGETPSTTAPARSISP